MPVLAPGSYSGGIPPASPPPPPGSGGSGSSAGGESQPSTWQQYMKLILADPIYQKTVNDLKAASVSDSTHLGSGILGALVNRGLVPDISSSAAKLGLSPDIVKWISHNVNLGEAQALANQANAAGLSQEAQMQLAHRTAMGNIKDSLAARGLVRSGATPFLTGQEEHTLSTNEFNADKALADYINGAYSAFAQAEQGRQGSLEQALEDAYSRTQSQLDAGTVGGSGSSSSGGGSSAGGGSGSAVGGSNPDTGGNVTGSGKKPSYTEPLETIGPQGEPVLHTGNPARLPQIGPAVRRRVNNHRGRRPRSGHGRRY